MLSNLPIVTKNFLIINVLMLLATITFQSQINLIQVLGAHNFLSPLFEPYQIVTHFFMHGGITHLFFNMFGLIIFGSQLERIWGPKRFFWFYIICALGALAFYAGYGSWEMYQLKQQILALPDGAKTLLLVDDAIVQAAKTGEAPVYMNSLLNSYLKKALIPMVGASGAIYGVFVGFAVLFPNTELMLLFPPIPIKAKYLVGILMIVSLYLSFSGSNDNIAHLAHLGGGVIGFLLVKVYQKDKTRFY